MSNHSQYGGGGSYGQNYYDKNADFSIQPAPSHQSQQGDFNQAVNQAKYHNTGKEDASDDEETSLFSKAIGFISEHKDRFDKEDVDEDQAVGAHQALYGDGSGGSGKDDGRTHDAEYLGSGAAMQALKMFMSDDGDKKGDKGGGHDQNKLIGIAMAQAGKLWDKENKQGKASTDKQSAVNSAAKMALKMYMKGSGGSSGGGAGGLGGFGGLAGRLGGQSSGSDIFNLAKKYL